jgi:GNAT superfamily N-acetyltransferase
MPGRPRYRFRRISLGRPWCEALELANGRRLIVRPIEAGDADTLRKSFGRLTPEEIRYRFLHPITELTPAYARQLTDLDGRTAFALAIVEALPPTRALIGGVGRVVVDGDRAEFALIVGREITGFGLGSFLLQRLTEWCRKRGLAILFGDVMLENRRMLALTRRLGFHCDFDLENPQVVRVWKSLAPTE